jgi:hypothetical protein
MRERLFMKRKPIAGQFAAKKLSGGRTIKYHLWIDEAANLYVQLKKNDAQGTFSSLLFSVTEYAPIRHGNSDIGHLTGFDASSGTRKNSSNNNDGAFLKAVLLDLLP